MAPMKESTVTRTFQVYGRKAHAEPLAFLGRLEAEDGAGLRAKALTQFGDAGWVELVAFPEEAIVQVIPGKGREG